MVHYYDEPLDEGPCFRWPAVREGAPREESHVPMGTKCEKTNQRSDIGFAEVQECANTMSKTVCRGSFRWADGIPVLETRSGPCCGSMCRAFVETGHRLGYVVVAAVEIEELPGYPEFFSGVIVGLRKYVTACVFDGLRSGCLLYRNDYCLLCALSKNLLNIMFFILRARKIKHFWK